MEATAEKLEVMFKKADANIDLLSRKLYVELLDCEEKSGKQGTNPQEVLQKLSEIKKEYAEIVQEAQAIKQAQAEAMEFFKTELQAVCTTLSKLQATTGMQSEDKSEELKQMEEVLGVLADDEEGDEVTEAGDATAAAQPSLDFTRVSRTSTESTQDTELSPLVRRQQSADFLPLTEDEFLTVSDLVRGRVKLSEVNQTYRLIWGYFKEDGNSGPLTAQSMFKMGLRVTGHTGEAKLKVLRSLKLLKINKNGSIVLT